MKKIGIYVLAKDNYSIDYIVIDDMFVYGKINDMDDIDDTWEKCAPNQPIKDAPPNIKFKCKLTETEMKEMLFLDLI